MRRSVSSTRQTPMSHMATWVRGGGKCCGFGLGVVVEMKGREPGSGGVPIVICLGWKRTRNRIRRVNRTQGASLPNIPEFGTLWGLGSTMVWFWWFGTRKARKGQEMDCGRFDLKEVGNGRDDNR